MTSTSAMSYRQALADGLIGQRQLEVLEFIASSSGPVSQGECGRYYNDAASSYQPRFKELEDSGIIECVGTREDEVTGKTVKIYSATGKQIADRVRATPKKRLTECPHCGKDLYP